jgi:cytochrome c-type biogenesis protein
MDPATFFLLSFLAGVYAAVGAPCALVLYPGYLSFLAGRAGNQDYRLAPFTLGIFVALGVIIFMLIAGLLFSAAMQVWGGLVNDILTPVAFIILLILSLVLIFDISFGQISLPNPVSRLENPVLGAVFLGLAFGIIILPCNAAVVAVLIALASTASGLFEGLGAFLSFGLGIILPLLILAGLSQAMSRQVTGYLTRHQRGVRLVSGIIMLMISVWYFTLLFLPHLMIQ